MNGGGTFENNRVQEISYISRNMKEMARELNVPVMSAASTDSGIAARASAMSLIFIFLCSVGC